MNVSFDCAVVASHLRFDGVWQRPHHLIARLARRVPVLFVEEPYPAAADRTGFERHGAVDVMRPERTELGAPMFDAPALELIGRWAGVRRPLIWVYTPAAEPLVEAFPNAPVVYDLLDDLAPFAFARAGRDEREGRLLERAGLVVAESRSLFRRVRELGPKVRLHPSGVDVEHFAAAQTAAPHPLFDHLTGPVCGYAGVVDERIEYDLIVELAERAVDIVMAGPVTNIDGSALPRRTNVHFTGRVSYAELPSFLAGFDVALLPFARSVAGRSTSPVKALEYMAAGLPAVSTGIAGAAADFGDVVRFADGDRAFADACIAALEPDAERIERGVAAARLHEWDAIFSRMWNDLKGE